jgi:hypothetical protein
MQKIISNAKAHLADWFQSSKSKRLLATVITVVVTTIGTNDGWLTESQSLNVAGVIIAFIIGDSYRPVNPVKIPSE